MVVTKTKIFAAACLLGLGAETSDLVFTDETQPDAWEIVNHPSYETILTVQNRYTGDLADPMEVFIQTDAEGNAVGYQWSSSIIDIPQSMRDQKPYICAADHSGALTIVNTFTGESVSPMETNISQPRFSDDWFCTTEKTEDGLVGVYATNGPEHNHF